MPSRITMDNPMVITIRRKLNGRADGRGNCHGRQDGQDQGQGRGQGQRGKKRVQANGKESPHNEELSLCKVDYSGCVIDYIKADGHDGVDAAHAQPGKKVLEYDIHNVRLFLI
jgi:hypothetical protein